MSAISPAFLLLAIAALFFAGFVKGTAGFGISLIVVPILVLVVTPQEAIILNSLPVLMMNFATAVTAAREYRELRRVRWMLPVAFVCVPFGVELLLWVDPDPMRAAIGLMVILFIAMRLFGWRSPQISEAGQRIFGVGMGALVGFVFGAITMPIAFIIFYLNVLGLKREAFVFLLNIIATALSIIQVSTFAAHNLYAEGAWRSSVLMLLPALAGLYAGTRLRWVLSERVFERIVLGLLAVAGLILIVRYGTVLF
ncbi:sulfite exporter TauE/SafE family protein [Nitrospinota bacterium]